MYIYIYTGQDRLHLLCFENLPFPIDVRTCRVPGATLVRTRLEAQSCGCAVAKLTWAMCAWPDMLISLGPFVLI